MKLKKALSVNSLLTSGQNVEEMHQILFNKQDRMLMQMQKRRVVTSESSSQDESGEGDDSYDFTPSNVRSVFTDRNVEKRKRFSTSLKHLLNLYEGR